MKIKEFLKNDKSKGEAYFPENGDEYTPLEATVRTFSHPAIVNGKAIIIKNHTIKVETSEGIELFLNISEGQKKVLDKTLDLTGKKIKFENYEHKQYGKLLGARVVKEAVKK